MSGINKTTLPPTKRQAFAKRKKRNKAYYIITDSSETEKNYLYGFCNSLPDSVRNSIVVKVISKVKPSKFIETCEYYASLQPTYSELWIVFDRDRVPYFDKIISTATEKHINIGWSNPCIEVWFFAYLGKMKTYSDSVVCCREFAEKFKKLTGSDYLKSDTEIYRKLLLLGNEEKAISLNKQKEKQYKNDGKLKPSEMLSYSALYKLIEQIRVND